MPKKPRTPQEIKEIRERILKEALDIINRDGFEGLSMRKLAGRLGVKAVTIYNYYANKDDLYLAVLTRGFQMLYGECRRVYDSTGSPEENLQAMIRAYLQFGLEHPHFYNLMFTWHVPKYGDYIGTTMEEAARYELEESQKVLLLLIKAVRELGESHGASLNEEEIRSHIVYFWSTLHGYIAGINNELLYYMYDFPLNLQEEILKNLYEHMERKISERRGKNAGSTSYRGD